MILRKIKPISVLALAAALAGCGATDTLLPNQLSTRSIEGIQTHQGPTSDADKIKVMPLDSNDLSCPVIDIAEGGASQRVGGEDNKSVRYQFTIANVSRNCQPRGTDAVINVGVSGYLLVGPAGSPGNFSTDLKVLVTSGTDKKLVYQKAYKIAVNTNGDVRGAFELIFDPIVVPLTQTNLDDLYTVTIGLGNSVNAKPAATKPQRVRKSAQN
jgi:hypothetical protein